VVVDLSRAMSYDAQLSADSTALIIEIPGAVSEASLDEVKVEAAGVGSVHTRTLAGGTQDSRVEVTFELEARIAWKHFSLPAERAQARANRGGHRANRRAFAGDDGAADSDAVDASPLPTECRSASGPEPPPAPGRSWWRSTPVTAGTTPEPSAATGLPRRSSPSTIAQRIARDLNLRSGIRAVMTRETDVYLTLPQRNEIAEKLGADVLREHSYSTAPSSSARGAEIYFVAPAAPSARPTRR
jgi:N-acetylmuramoyl-L-alanine amidase